MTTTGKIKLFALIAILAGPALAYWGQQEKTKLAELEKSGVTVDGFIIGGKSKTGKGSYHSFTVDYKQADGAKVSRDFKVQKTFFQAHVSGDAVSDPDVKVRYLPAQTETAIIVNGSTDNTNMLPIGIGAFLVGLLTFGFMKLRKL